VFRKFSIVLLMRSMSQASTGRKCCLPGLITAFWASQAPPGAGKSTLAAHVVASDAPAPATSTTSSRLTTVESLIRLPAILGYEVVGAQRALERRRLVQHGDVELQTFCGRVSWLDRCGHDGTSAPLDIRRTVVGRGSLGAPRNHARRSIHPHKMATGQR
jgi:hypothetical protein